jgi:hypothetical protein
MRYSLPAFGTRDRVSFHAEKKGAGPTRTDPTHPDAACYSDCRPDFHSYTIHCFPRHGKTRVSLEDALTLFNTLTGTGIVPEGIEIWEKTEKEGRGEKGIHCRIGASSNNPHNVYVALVCYRWIDSHPALTWEFARLVEANPERHPFQILVYVTQKYLYNYNHSFISLGGYGGCSPLNPLVPLATKIYFDPGDERGKKDYETANTHVCTGINRIVTAMTQTTPSVKDVSKSWSTGTARPKYFLEKPIDVLHPRVSELCFMKEATPEKINEFLSTHFTEEEQQK